MNKLHSSAVYPLPSYLCLEYEEINYITCILMDRAERKYRKLHKGEITWSPAYKKVYLLLLYSHLCKGHSNGLNSNIQKFIVLQKN